MDESLAIQEVPTPTHLERCQSTACEKYVNFLHIYIPPTINDAYFNSISTF